MVMPAKAGRAAGPGARPAGSGDQAAVALGSVADPGAGDAVEIARDDRPGPRPPAPRPPVPAPGGSAPTGSGRARAGSGGRPRPSTGPSGVSTSAAATTCRNDVQRDVAQSGPPRGDHRQDGAAGWSSRTACHAVGIAGQHRLERSQRRIARPRSEPRCRRRTPAIERAIASMSVFQTMQIGGIEGEGRRSALRLGRAAAPIAASPPTAAAADTTRPPRPVAALSRSRPRRRRSRNGQRPAPAR